MDFSNKRLLWSLVMQNITDCSMHPKEMTLLNSQE
jgi:hypothetical protein